jgi:CRISPR-associated protein Cmr4
MMRKEYYLLKVLTPLHIGAGQGLGHVDLPIVREGHTNFPYIPGTSLKGALRKLGDQPSGEGKEKGRKTISIGRKG